MMCPPELVGSVPDVVNKSVCSPFYFSVWFTAIYPPLGEMGKRARKESSPLRPRTPGAPTIATTEIFAVLGNRIAQKNVHADRRAWSLMCTCERRGSRWCSRLARPNDVRENTMATPQHPSLLEFFLKLIFHTHKHIRPRTHWHVTTIIIFCTFKYRSTWIILSVVRHPVYHDCVIKS